MKLECGHDSTQNDPELNDVTNTFQQCAGPAGSATPERCFGRDHGHACTPCTASRFVVGAFVGVCLLVVQVVVG